jgi:quercetin 2,3-dioxygenase
MLTIRRSQQRGWADHGWLKSRHTFSFAEYYDPGHMGFRTLRVINEDRIAADTGFGAHPHRDMEIISYVISGALEHQDSMGNKSTIRPGEVQRMSAASGVVHSEHNASTNSETHFFQIWIRPNQTGGNPGYGQKSFEEELKNQKLTLVISKDGREGSIEIKQDADMYIARAKKNEDIVFDVRPGRGVWIQVVKGTVVINDQTLQAGDAVSTETHQSLKIFGQEDSELIIFDLA